MRRLARHLFTLCSAVALLLCVALCVLWVRSHTARDVITYCSERDSVTLTSYNGHVGLNLTPTYHGADAIGITPGWFRNTDRIPPGSDAMDGSEYRRFAEWGFAFGPNSIVTVNDTLSGRPFAWNTGYSAYCPHWAALLPPAGVIGVFMRQRYRRRRATSGLCPSCGYDLRASPERCSGVRGRNGSNDLERRFSAAAERQVVPAGYRLAEVLEATVQN